MKKMNNKGFSLVELIVVIAIMVVLVAVLAPVFTKYVEQSRRSTDVTNAQSIAESVLADVADGAKDDSGNDIIASNTNTNVVAGNPTAVRSTPTPKAKDAGANFVYNYDPGTNYCHVYVAANTSLDLTDSACAEAYKQNGKDATAPAGSGQQGGGQQQGGQQQGGEGSN